MTFIDPTRSNREILSSIYYPASTAGESVPVAADSFPVIAFGHGFVIPWTDYGYLQTTLSSSGFIVVFPRTETSLSPSHTDFSLDLAFCINSLRNLNDLSQSLFFQHIDASACVMGHSMGGGASLLAASDHPAISAVVTLAAAETSPSAITAASAIDIPALFITGDQDCITPLNDHQLPMYEAMNSDCKTIAILTGASHCQFAANSSLCRSAEIFSGCSANIDRITQETRTSALLIPWLDAVLNASETSWADFQSELTSGTQSGILTFQQDCPIPPASTPVAPSATPSPMSTSTPTATQSAAQTATPTAPISPTTTPSACSTAGVTLRMPGTMFYPGDHFYMIADVCNPTETIWLNVPFFVILDVAGVYYYAPGWSSSVEFSYLTIAPGVLDLTVIPEFVWPDSVGSGSGAVVYGAITDSGITALIGEFGYHEFGWSQ